MSLENSDTLELKDRLNYLISNYADISLELAKKLEEFGKIRKELQLIIIELENRGEKVEYNIDEEKFDEARRLKQSLSDFR